MLSLILTGWNNTMVKDGIIVEKENADGLHQLIFKINKQDINDRSVLEYYLDKFVDVYKNTKIIQVNYR